MNDTLFLSIVNVVDYSILVGFDEDSHEIVVGIIDYLRQVRSNLHRHHAPYFCCGHVVSECGRQQIAVSFLYIRT